MGLLNGALEIGRSALLTYQSALQVTGNNLSNAGSEVYTRQTAVLTPSTGGVLPEGFTVGGGVSLTALQRNVDESLQDQLRASISNESRALVEQQALSNVESICKELTDNDLSTLLQEFFNAFSSLQNEPHDLTDRDVVLTQADLLVGEIQRERGELLSLRDRLNDSIEAKTGQANDLIAQITALNVQIAQVEASSQGGANALRDQRDGLLNELSELIAIQVREQPDGSINVYAGNEPLIQGGFSRGIVSEMEIVNDEPVMTIRYADNGGEVALAGGELAGLVAARDDHVMVQVEQLDSLARVLIEEVNKLHSEGQGLQGYTDITSDYAVLDSGQALNHRLAGLDLTPENGSFLITLSSTSDGTSETAMISVDLDGIGEDETLESLAAKINVGVSNITATITTDNRLQLVADDGFEISFSEDTSHVLAALGVNTFFSGRDGQDISVNQLLKDDPNLLAAATGGVSVAGDGSNAGRIAALGDSPVDALDGVSVTDFYNAIASDLAVKGAAASSSAEAASSIHTSLISQRESISGVNLDEETILLLRLERAFQGAARYTSTVNELLDDLMALIG